ncbi:acyltransferase family protein [Uliginosibacterium sp. sgz301328]|uniref:acyltransferase family protein n=1 Tax=Uliginosibacterium sp. sgz301328 TaxID=3243764 RepID=UPI00359E92F4
MHSELLEAGARMRARAVGKAGPVTRYKFVDNAKALGIVLVLLGHSKGMPAGMLNLIYGFHMPLFFFLSGYLLKPARLADPVNTAGVRLLRALAVPYVFFFGISYLYWLLTRDIGYKAERFENLTWHDPLAGLFSGLGSDLYINPPLWFFPGLLVTALAYHLIRKVLSSRGTVIASVAVAVGVCALASDPEYRLPLGLDTLWVALPFYAMGQYARDNLWMLARLARVGAPALLCMMVTWILLSFANGHADLAEMLFGAEPLLYVPIATLAVMLVTIGAHRVPASRVARWLSDNTLIIFPTHMLVFSVLSGTASALGLVPVEDQYTPVWAIGVTVLTLCLTVPLAWALRRMPPALLGRTA